MSPEPLTYIMTSAMLARDKQPDDSFIYEITCRCKDVPVPVIIKFNTDIAEHLAHSFRQAKIIATGDVKGFHS